MVSHFRLRGLEALSQGKLTTSLLRPAALHDSIIKAEAEAELQFKNHKFTTEGVFDVYNIKPIFLFDNRYIYVRIKIIMESDDSAFALYNIEILPQPYVGKESTDAYTVLTGVKPLIAVSNDISRFFEMTTQEFQQCIINHQRQIACPHTFPTRSVSNPSCSFLIWQGNLQGVREACGVDYVHDGNPEPRLFDIGDGLIYVITPPKYLNLPWLLSCDGKHVKYLPVCTNCAVALPCSCSLTLGIFYIGKFSHTCNASISEPDFYYSSNLPLILQHYNTADLDK